MSVMMLNVWAIMRPSTVLFVTNAAPWHFVFNVAGNDFIVSSIFNVFIIIPRRIKYSQNANDNYQHATVTSSANIRTSRYVIMLNVDEFPPFFRFSKNDQFYGN
jgi:dipeptide/tripeptide permease